MRETYRHVTKNQSLETESGRLTLTITTQETPNGESAGFHLSDANVGVELSVFEAKEVAETMLKAIRGEAINIVLGA